MEEKSGREFVMSILYDLLEDNSTMGVSGDLGVVAARLERANIAKALKMALTNTTVSRNAFRLAEDERYMNEVQERNVKIFNEQERKKINDTNLGKPAT